MKPYFLFILYAICSLHSASSRCYAQETIVIREGEAFHLNNAPDGGKVALLAPNMQETYDSRVMAALLGIKLAKPWAQEVEFEFASRRSSNLEGALFSVDRNGRKTLYYNVYLFDDQDTTTGSRYFALAHELGHYVCGHAEGKRVLRTSKEMELEADRFAGAALKRANDLWGETSINAVPQISKGRHARGELLVLKT